jgi:hypothetical protein
LSTPDPLVLPVAERVTWTGGEYTPVEQMPLLQVIVVVGGVPSIWIACDCAALAFPALSTERYLTVEVLETVNGRV